MRAQGLFLLFLLAAPLLSGCGGKKDLPRLGMDDVDAKRTEAPVSDPKGPIPAPRLPPELARAAPAPEQDEPGQALPYSVVCEVVFDPPQGGDAPPPAQEEEKSAILGAFTSGATIFTLIDSPPASLNGLEQRLSTSLDKARDVLRGRGYYEGRVSGAVEAPAGAGDKAVARVIFSAGPLYRMGATSVNANLPPMTGEGAQEARENLPATLAGAGLAEGAPARAADVLAAVERVRQRYLESGYPFAEIAGARYIADHEKRLLEAEISVRPGPFTRLGPLLVEGAPPVRPAYIEALRAWRPGEPWRQSRVEAFRDSLRQSGLFQSIEIEPVDTDDENGVRPVRVKLAGAPERTVGGALKYHTDFGPGLQASWEHRNLTGRGDSLRLSAPLWADMQELNAAYRLPFFLRRDQDFVANAAFLNQDTDAYRLTSTAASAGLERRLARFWSAGVQGGVQGGNIKEPDKPGRDYVMGGIPMTLRYDDTGSLLNAVRGLRLMTSAAPYIGQYDGGFSVLRARVEGQAFIPAGTDGRFVLALRGVLGATTGEHSDKLPPSIRFYSGGGGSVRGYEYQSIGPRNADKKPLGGGSLAEFSAESRWNVTEEWGLVAFLDGGSAYSDLFADAGREMRWGAGLGLRYYTAVGPLRLDVATPLNPRKDDDEVQLYISIGQSF